MGGQDRSEIRIGALVLVCWLASLLTMSPLESRAHAEERAPESPWRYQALVTVHRFLPGEPTPDPDQPAFRYGFQGGRWNAMLGDGLVLGAAESDALRLGLALEAFVALENFTTDQPLPWQSFRANVGFELLAGSPRLSRALLPAGGTLQVGLGWFHESDHVAAQGAYDTEFLLPAQIGRFDNGDFNSFEYVKLRAIYRQVWLDERLTLQVALGARLFPPPIDSLAARGQRLSGLAEARVTWRASSSLHPYLAGYFELVKNDFGAHREGFAFDLERDPFRFAILDVGLDLVSRNGAMVSPYLRYSNSFGRGVDFPRDYGGQFGFGFAALP
jgi:hypothetical protein